MESDYGWIITEDLIDSDYLESDREGIMGPSTIPEDIEDQLEDGEGREFRMLDDDGNVYYKGRLIGDRVFGPLYDFGMPDAGAVHIHYRDESGQWDHP